LQKITKSLAISSLFPKSVLTYEEMKNTINFLADRGFSMLEFYYSGGKNIEIGSLLKKNGFASIFLAVFPLKASGKSLCAVEEENRKEAVGILKHSIDTAHEIGSKAVMINSGTIPMDKILIDVSYQNYIKSLEEAFSYIAGKGYEIGLLLEPGDSHIDAFQLIGPVDRVCQSAIDLRAKGYDYRLTMDTAHICEEGENAIESIRKVLPYCNHIHLCNCYMADPTHPMYGDKHVGFEFQGGCFGYDDFAKLYVELKDIFQDKDFTVTLEALCRDDDPELWFMAMVGSCQWLFT
jgi:sugar phosphate isomerase/epimerase